MTKLDEAKLNLKTVLEKLDSSIEKGHLSSDPEQVDKNLRNQLKSLEEQKLDLEKSLKDKDEEIEYLREENIKLQAGLGERDDKIFKLKSSNDEALERVDAILGETKSYLSNKGYL